MSYDPELLGDGYKDRKERCCFFAQLRINPIPHEYANRAFENLERIPP